MASLSEPTNTRSFPFPPQDWAQTPLAVQAYVRTLRDEVAQLHDRVETLQARLTQNSTTSSRPPSADSPYKKPRRRMTSTTPRKAVGNRAIRAIARRSSPHDGAGADPRAVCVRNMTLPCSSRTTRIR